MKTNKKYWNDLAACLSGEMNEMEEKAFRERMSDNMEMNEDYRLMKLSWKNFNSNPDSKFKDTSEAWNKLSKRMADEGMVLDNKSAQRRMDTNQLLRIAAVIVLILSVGIPLVLYSNKDNFVNENYLESESLLGNTTVDLPDGSRVFLNKGAHLKYKKSFDEDRSVSLKGEGYFDVMSDPNRPFRVSTGKVTVTVLGTSFNVKEKENQAVEVFVESGKVQVELNENGKSILLEPGEMGSAEEGLEMVNLNNNNYLSWKTKDFKFVDENIPEILDVLESAYHVTIDDGDLALDEVQLTSTYSGESLESILSTICMAIDLTYNKENGIYKLHSK